MKYISQIILFFFSVLLLSVAVGTWLQSGSETRNYLVNSSSFHKSGWIAQNVTVVPDVIEAPNGTQTADLIKPKQEKSYIYQDIRNIPIGQYVYSVFLKANTDHDISLYTLHRYGSENWNFQERPITVTNQWKRFDLNFDISKSKNQLIVQVGGEETLSPGENLFAWGGTVLHASKALSSGNYLDTPYISINWFNPKAIICFAGFITLLSISLSNRFRYRLLQHSNHSMRFVRAQLEEYPAQITVNFNSQNFLTTMLVSASVILPLLLTSPIFLFLSQSDAYDIGLTRILEYGVYSTVVVVLASSAFLSFFPSVAWRFSLCVLAAFALFFTAENQLVIYFTDIGELRGQEIEWNEYSMFALVEAILAVFFLLTLSLYLFIAPKPLLKKVTAFVIIFQIALTLPILVGANEQISFERDERGKEFYSLSPTKNFIFYQPDSMTSPTVEEILAEDPELAAVFDGFTMYTDHLSAYNGTLISTYSVFTGENADIADDGYGSEEFKAAVDKNGVLKHLVAGGYTLDLAPVYEEHCFGASYNICVPRHLFDLKPKGLADLETKPTDIYALLIDISLYRAVPFFLKKEIHNGGNWFLREKLTKVSTSRNGIGLVLMEMIEKGNVEPNGPPRFKWYGSLGAHRPEQYDQNCKPLDKPIYSYEASKNQHICVLREYAEFIKFLKRVEIFDKTILVVNADTGAGNLANDFINAPSDAASLENRQGVEPHLNHLSMARPLLMIKPLYSRGELKFSKAPTHQVNIPSTILDLAGIESKYQEPSVTEISETTKRERKFFRIHFPIRYGNVFMDFDEYTVTGPANDWNSFKLDREFREK